jgi:O-antigen/teichoic acid export membrane protein
MQVSAVQLSGVAAVLLALSACGIDSIWLPLTALGSANLLSLAAGLALVRSDGNGEAAVLPPTRHLLRLGTWLLLAIQGDQVSGFVGAALLAALAGAGAVGHVEAARQLAQPVFVLAIGLQSVLRPRVMSAAQRADSYAARHYSSIYGAALGVAGLGYALLVGVPWPGSPLVGLFPNAFDLDGMLFSFILVTTVAVFCPILAVQAIGARRERDVVRVNLTNQVFFLGTIAALGATVGAVVMPIASAVYLVTWLVRFRPVLKRIYIQDVTTMASGCAASPASARH